ncbi:MAG: hypothetical protein ACREDT_13245 [Methylocella sp.]
MRFLALDAACANRMPIWHRTRLANSAGSAPSVLDSPPSSIAAGAGVLFRGRLKKPALAPPVPNRRQAEESGGRRTAEHAGDRAPSALVSAIGPKIFDARRSR